MNNKVFAIRIVKRKRSLSPLDKYKKEWFEGIEVKKTKSPYDLVVNAISTQDNKISEFFRKGRTTIHLNEINTNAIVFMTTKRIVLPEKVDYPNVIHIGPHSDDVCSVASFLSTQGIRFDTIFSSLFAADHIGVSLKDAVDILNRNKQYSHSGQNLTTRNLLQYYAEQERITEFHKSCKSLGLNPLPVDPRYFYTSSIVIDNSNIIHSYISEFLTKYKNHNYLLALLKEKVSMVEKKRSKQLLLLPFIFDYHPVHRKLSELFISLYLKLPDRLRNRTEIWFYSTGDLLKNFKGNIYYPYKSATPKVNAWNDYPTQLSRHPEYPMWWLNNDRHNAAQINLSAPYAEKFIKVKVKVKEIS